MSAELKRERFEKLAHRRVNAALKQLQLIGNLSNRRNYVYTDDHVRQMLEVLESGLRNLKHRFRHEGIAGGQKFEFKD